MHRESIGSDVQTYMPFNDRVRSQAQEREVAMHAVVSHVTIREGRADDAVALLDQVIIPAAESAHGFVSGVWSHSLEGKGVGVIVFETEDDARKFAAESQAAPVPDDSPVQIDAVGVNTVARTA